MTLVERHYRPHYPIMPYKYTPVSARFVLIPLLYRIRTPLTSALPFASFHPIRAYIRPGHPGMAATATANASPIYRSISQKRQRAQTLVLAMPMHPTPPSASITPHPSYSHSQPYPSYPQPQPHPYSQPPTGPNSAHPTGAGHLQSSSSSSSHVSEILPRLYISDLQSAEDAGILSELGITHVLSAMQGHVALPPALVAHAAQVPLHDAPFAELAAHLPRTTRYIARALRSSPDARVLVHCAMGASRSVAVVCGYLIAAHDLHPAQALEFVKARRAVAAPNRGFIDQLHEYHRSVVSSGAVLD